MIKRKLNITNEGKDFTIDPVTRSARFLKNNKAALIHGGYSKKIDETLINSALDNDLALETGLLKGQLLNLATLGQSVISGLIAEGDEITALHLALACADRTSKLIPQIQKLLESDLLNIEVPDVNTEKVRKRILKKFQDNKCSALEVAYLYEVQNLGSLPHYIKQSVAIELSEQSKDVEDTFTREELELRAQKYWKETQLEAQQRLDREKAVLLEKRKLSNCTSTCSDNKKYPIKGCLNEKS